MISTSLIVMDVRYSATAFLQVQIFRLLKWKSKAYFIISNPTPWKVPESLPVMYQSPIMSDTSGFNYIPSFSRADIQFQDVL